jgi:hypothetical protein
MVDFLPKFLFKSFRAPQEVVIISNIIIYQKDAMVEFPPCSVAPARLTANRLQQTGYSKPNPAGTAAYVTTKNCNHSRSFG